MQSVDVASSLDDAKSSWEQSEIDDYLVIVTQSGHALDGCRWVTEVHGDHVNSRWSSMVDVECGERDVSVPALHEQVPEGMTESEAESGHFSVTWSEAGVPRTIVSNLGTNGGEAVSLDIEFRDLSSQDGGQSVRSALADARARWADAEISHYRLQVVEARNYWRRDCGWGTVVADGVVSRVSVDSLADSQACFDVEWTVEKLHDQISSWADDIDEFNERE